MYFRIPVILLVLIPCFVWRDMTSGQEKRVDGTMTVISGQKTITWPVVDAREPKMGSVDAVIYLSGHRLYQDHWDKTKVFFTQNKVESPARTAGGWSRI